MSLEEQCRLLLCNGHVTDKDAFQTLHLRMLCNMASLLQTALGTTPEGVPAHTHLIADITALQAALDSKAATSHSHVISDVTGLQTALDTKTSAFTWTSSEQVWPFEKDIGGGNIYAKAFAVANYPNATSATIAHGITGLLKTIMLKPVLTNGSAHYIAGTSAIGPIYADIQTTNVRIVTTANYSTFSGTIYMLYTRS